MIPQNWENYKAPEGSEMEIWAGIIYDRVFLAARQEERAIFPVGETPHYKNPAKSAFLIKRVVIDCEPNYEGVVLQFDIAGKNYMTIPAWAAGPLSIPIMIAPLQVFGGRILLPGGPSQMTSVLVALIGREVIL